MSREEFEHWGFRWPTSTTLHTARGEVVTIVPYAYLASRESSATTDRSRKALREYQVHTADGRFGSPISELQVEELLGIADQS